MQFRFFTVSKQQRKGRWGIFIFSKNKFFIILTNNLYKHIRKTNRVIYCIYLYKPESDLVIICKIYITLWDDYIKNMRQCTVQMHKCPTYNIWGQ